MLSVNYLTQTPGRNLDSTNSNYLLLTCLFDFSSKSHFTISCVYKINMDLLEIKIKYTS